MNRLYKETFSQVRSSYEFKLEDFETMKTNTRTTLIIRKSLIVAACVAVLAAFGVTASATGFFGLHDAQIDRNDEDMTISMVGWAASPEGQAERDIMTGEKTPEQAAQAYGLTIPQSAEVLEYDQLTELLGGEIFRGGHSKYSALVYDEGSISLDDDFTAADGTRIGCQVLRTVKGSLLDVSLSLEAEEDFDQWTESIDGVDVYLTELSYRSLIMADLGTGFLSVNVLAGSVGGDYGPITPDHLRELAGSLDYNVLKTVAAPEITQKPQITFGAGVTLEEENILEEQSFKTTLTGIGPTYFVTYRPTEEFSDVRFFLSGDRRTSDFEFHPILTGMSFADVAAVSFEDLTGDGNNDVLVLVDYLTAEGEAYRQVRIFTADGSGRFDYAEKLSDEVMGAIVNSRLDVRAVRGFLMGRRSGTGEGWSASYLKILEQAAKNSENMSGYAAWDLDGDGVPELMLESGDSEAAATMTVYTMRGSRAVSVGEFDMFHSNLYIDDSGSLLRVMGQMGQEEIYEITLSGGKVQEKRISERDIGEGDYSEPGRLLMLMGLDDPIYLTKSAFADIKVYYGRHCAESGETADWIEYDLDGDGRDELLVNLTGRYGYGVVYVYAWDAEESRALPVGMLEGGDDLMYIAGPDGLYLDYRDLDNGRERIERAVYADGGVTVENVATLENPSADTWAGFQYGPAVTPRSVSDPDVSAE